MLLGEVGDFGLCLFHLGLEVIGRAMVDRLFVAKDLLQDFRGNRDGGAAVHALGEVARFAGDGGIALAGEDVQDSLGADDLRAGGNERRITEVGADSGVLFEDFGELVLGALFAELADKVRNHAARDLVGDDTGIDTEEAGFELPVLLTDAAEVISELAELLHIEAGCVLRVFGEGGDERFGCGLAGAAGEGRNGAVDDVGAGLDTHEVGHFGEAACVVAVHLDEDVGVLLADPFDEGLRHHRAEEAGHVLDGDRVGAHFDHLVGELRERVNGMDGRGGIADGALHVAAGLFDGAEGGFEVPGVVQGVEDAEDVHAVLDGAVAELIDDVIGVVAVADGVLAAEEHLGGRLLEPLFDFAEALPRVLLEEAEAGIEGGAAPAFDGVVADGVHELEDGDHVLGAHAGREERLVAIADGRFHDADFGHVFVPRGECGEAWARLLLRVPSGRRSGDSGGGSAARMR
ncbi:MAG: hypothetical protein KatS3mg063_1801 [Tepidiforma sp.]|nr:hypothetical protein [Tepidiforma sp.]GIW15948.1 MAG: hypothetical protein KatS3mg063_1801 [Tepidiforma sp.]